MTNFIKFGACVHSLVHTLHTAIMATLKRSAFLIHTLHTVHTAIFKHFLLEITQKGSNTHGTHGTHGDYLLNPPTRNSACKAVRGYYGKIGVCPCVLAGEWI